MGKSIRHLAVDILTLVHQHRKFAATLIDQCLDAYKLSGTADGRLLTHLVYGELRFQGHLDWIITKLYQGDFSTLNEKIKNVLRVALYQLKFSERIPDFAVVDEAVKVAKKIQPAKGALVNAILRNYLRSGKSISFPSFQKNAAEHIASFHSHPLWLVNKWIDIFGKQQTLALCTADNEVPPLTIRVNTLKATREELKEKLADSVFISKETIFSPDGFTLSHADQPIQKTSFFRQGLIRIQDEGSQCISYLVGPKNNETVLDICAGTGGKTTHLAAILKNKGEIVAADYDSEKISELQKELARMGIANVTTEAVDLSNSLPDSLKERFDHVLVDAPCSGTGTLRRNPEIKWRLRPEDLRNYISGQKRILDNAAWTVKKGGRLIYSTCSLLPEENECIIDDFIESNKRFSLEKPPSSIKPQLLDKRNFYHTYPHTNNMDGFFGAILKCQ